MAQALPLLVVVLLVGVTAAAYRIRNGVPHATHDRLSAADLAEIGAPARTPFLLLFTAPGCASCTPARRMLDSLGANAGTPVVSIDVSGHDALAAAHHVMRAPTTFVVAADGRIVARISGVPREPQLAALLEEHVAADIAA